MERKEANQDAENRGILLQFPLEFSDGTAKHNYYSRILRSRPGLIAIEKKRIERYETITPPKAETARIRLEKYQNELQRVREESGWKPKKEELGISDENTKSALPSEETGSRRWWHIHRWPGHVVTRYHEIRYFRREKKEDNSGGGKSRKGIMMPLLMATGMIASGILGYMLHEKTSLPQVIEKEKVIEKIIEVSPPAVSVKTPDGYTVNVPESEIVRFIPPVAGEKPSLALEIPITSTAELNVSYIGEAREYFPDEDRYLIQTDRAVDDNEFSSIWGKAEAIWFKAQTGHEFNMTDSNQRRTDSAEYARLRKNIPSGTDEIAAIYYIIKNETNRYYNSMGFSGGPFPDGTPDIFAHFATIEPKNPAASTKVCFHELTEDQLKQNNCAKNFLVVPDDAGAKSLIRVTRNRFNIVQALDR